jgi:hypothetical protein
LVENIERYFGAKGVEEMITVELTGIMHQLLRYACKLHVGIRFCPKKLPFGP